MKRVLFLIKGLGRGGAERLLAGTIRHLPIGSKTEVTVQHWLPPATELRVGLTAGASTIRAVVNASALSIIWVRFDPTIVTPTEGRKRFRSGFSRGLRVKAEQWTYQGTAGDKAVISGANRVICVSPGRIP